MQTYKTIQYEQRILIAQYIKENKGQNEIGRLLSIDKSVISREIKRNSSPGTYKLYNAQQAEKRSRERSKNKGRKSLIVGVVKLKIDKLIAMKWSPDQINVRTKSAGENLACHETIYQYIYKDKREGGTLFMHLRQTHRARHKRCNTYRKRGIIKDRISISERPEIVEQRTRLGDWEGDTMIGKNHKSAIVTMVDRTSKQTKIMKLKSKNARQTAAKITRRMKASKTPVLTITVDNGKEFSEHKRITKALNAQVYFADPYSAYQRGTNENTNGLIRQYLPKGTDLNLVSQYELKKIENSLNNRPRKSLGYLTPNEYICQTVAIKS